MALSLNKPKLDNLASDIWKSAERLRGKFKSYEYQSVILPILVSRRLECVLIDWREKKAVEVLKKRPKLTEKELAKLVKELELNPKQCPFSNSTDWTLRSVYEELLRLFSEQSGDEAGEHFTPREVVRLMVELLDIPIPDRHFSIYDPASGTGGMLSVAEEHLLDRAATAAEKARVEKFVTVHRQGLAPPDYPISQEHPLLQ